ncbi:hypothetical protein FOL46_005318 [Perkinsus olseni]|uniref:Uncharacterized protein n=1 Tax=Perkinsus olseni TaxID=32597 RepID=A0A7J6LT47_PEROL|nr:hypothetical protein FOL46_005318 [Perkinsus olseni]
MGGWTLLFGEGVTKILVQRVVYYLQLSGCCSAEVLSSAKGFGEAKTFFETALPVCLSRLLFPIDGVDELSEVTTFLSGALGTTLLPVQTKIVDLLVRMCEVGGPVYTPLLLLPSGPSTTELPTILTRLFIIFVAACHRAVSDTTDRSPYDLILKAMLLVRLLFAAESMMGRENSERLLTIEALKGCWDMCIDRPVENIEGCILALRELLSTFILILPIVLERHLPIFATVFLPRTTALLHETICFRSGVLARDILKIAAERDADVVKKALTEHPQWTGGLASRQELVLARLDDLNSVLLRMFVHHHHEADAKASEEASAILAATSSVSDPEELLQEGMIDPSELVERYGKRELGDVLGSRRDDFSAASGDNLTALRWSVACCIIDSDDDAGHELVHEHYLLEELLISLILCIVKTVGGGKCAIVIAAVKFIRHLASGVAKERTEWARPDAAEMTAAEGGKWEDDFAAAFFEFTNSEAEAFLNTDTRREAQSTKSPNNTTITSWDRADAVEKALIEYRTALVEDGNWQHPPQEPAVEDGERALIPDGIHRQKTPFMYQPSKSKQEEREPRTLADLLGNQSENEGGCEVVEKLRTKHGSISSEVDAPAAPARSQLEKQSPQEKQEYLRFLAERLLSQQEEWLCAAVSLSTGRKGLERLIARKHGPMGHPATELFQRLVEIVGIVLLHPRGPMSPKFCAATSPMPRAMVEVLQGGTRRPCPKLAAW